MTTLDLKSTFWWERWQPKSIPFRKITFLVYNFNSLVFTHAIPQLNSLANNLVNQAIDLALGMIKPWRINQWCQPYWFITAPHCSSEVKCMWKYRRIMKKRRNNHHETPKKIEKSPPKMRSPNVSSLFLVYLLPNTATSTRKWPQGKGKPRWLSWLSTTTKGKDRKNNG